MISGGPTRPILLCDPNNDARPSPNDVPVGKPATKNDQKKANVSEGYSIRNNSVHMVTTTEADAKAAEQAVAATAAAIAASAGLSNEGPQMKKQKKKPDEEQRHAADALTILCKAAGDSPEHKRPEELGARPNHNESFQAFLRMQQDRKASAGFGERPQQLDHNTDMRRKEQLNNRKRHFVATLSKPPMVAHVPRGAIFRHFPQIVQQVPHSQLQLQGVRFEPVRDQNELVSNQMEFGDTSAGFVPNAAGNGYFFGMVTSHGGTRKMNALGIPTMLVQLSQPQMHLSGFVVAGHVAWQDIGNCTDQGNWSIARCLMCIRHPSALEVMICDPTCIHPAIKHLYICPSHCVRRFMPNITDLKQQLKKDMISLPLTKPSLPFISAPSSAPAPRIQGATMGNNMQPTMQPQVGPAALHVVPPSMVHSAAPQASGGNSMAPMVMYRQVAPASRPVETKEHFCTTCNKEFSCKSSLNRHMRIHSGVKPFQCGTCGKRFADKGVLDVHERIHTGKKPYQCNQCTKVFSQKGNLKRHMRIHSGLRPYSCNLCNKRFSQKGHLTAHLRIHTGHKPYQCSYCHKSFTQSSTLIGHMRTHTGERPYSCTVCDKTFRQKGNLTAHMVMHQMQNGQQSAPVHGGADDVNKEQQS